MISKILLLLFYTIAFSRGSRIFIPSLAGSAKTKAEDAEAVKTDLQNKLAQIVPSSLRKKRNTK